MRAVEQTVGKTVLLVRLRVPEHAVLQPRHRVKQGQRRQFTARQNKVAEADLEVHMAVQKPLVDAFIATAQQHRARPCRELPNQGLVEPVASG